MRNSLKGALAGTAAAVSAAVTTRIYGFDRFSFFGMLYLYVVLGAGLKSSFSLPKFLERLVIVTEGEVLKMRKITTGEKYKIKGEVEKLQ